MRPLPAGVFLRALFLDASWHAERMQGLGFAHALAPALKRTKERSAALRRHAQPFATNLFMAPVLLGAVARLENEERGDEAERVRALLAAPLSGAGDLFFWGALRPAALAGGLVALAAGVPWLAMGCVWMGFALPGLMWRWRLLWRGYEAGASLPQQLPRFGVSRVWNAPLRWVAALAAGILLGWCVQAGWRGEGVALFHMGLALFLGYHAQRRLVSPGVAFFLLVAFVLLVRRANLTTPPW